MSSCLYCILYLYVSCNSVRMSHWNKRLLTYLLYLDRDPAPPEKRHRPPIFGPCLLTGAGNRAVSYTCRVECSTRGRCGCGRRWRRNTGSDEQMSVHSASRGDGGGPWRDTRSRVHRSSRSARYCLPLDVDTSTCSQLSINRFSSGNVAHVREENRYTTHVTIKEDRNKRN